MRRAVGVGLCQSNQKWACRTSNVLSVGCCSNVWPDRLDNKRPNSRRGRGEFRLAFCSGATHLSINRNHSRILNLFINSPSLSPALLYSKASESRSSFWVFQVGLWASPWQLSSYWYDTAARTDIGRGNRLTKTMAFILHFINDKSWINFGTKLGM